MSETDNLLPSLSKDLKLVAISDIQENNYNPNEVPEYGMEAIKESIRKRKMIVPIVVHRKTKEIIDGAHRFRAAKEMGFTKVFVIYTDESDPLELKKTTIALNKTARAGAFNPHKIDPLLAEFAADADDLAQLAMELGYGEDELDRFLKNSASWLDDLSSDDSVDGLPTEGDDVDLSDLPADRDYTKLQYVVDVEQKRSIIHAINRAKEELGVTLSAEALVHICDIYLKSVEN